MALLEIKTVNQTFWWSNSCWNLDLELNEELVGLIGPNGAGKTTTKTFDRCL